MRNFSTTHNQNSSNPLSGKTRGSGFVDLQVNGVAGVDFSSIDLDSAAVTKACQALAEDGTIAFCPTVITATMETYNRVLPLLAEAVERPGAGARPLGIHLEGPFISPADGAVGAHRREWTQPCTPDALDRLLELAHGTVKLITVAPELPGCEALISKAVAHGLRVSVGHTLASDDDIQRAVDAGATLSTHLGNGCPSMMHRHQNPIIAQLASPLPAMIISDGHHLTPSFMRVVAAIKGADKLIVTSDAAPCAGLAPGQYEVFGTKVELMANGMVRNLNAPTLAGSGSLMLPCANHAAAVLGWDETRMWRITRDNALNMLGLESELSLSGPIHWKNGKFTLAT